jgi:hypothetical protein
MLPLSETDDDMMMMNDTTSDDNTSSSNLTLLQQQKRSSTTSSIDSSALSLSVEDESVIEQRHAQAAAREAAIQDVHDGLTDGLTSDPAALLETAAASNGSGSNGSTVGHSHLPADLGPAVLRAKLPASVAAAMSLKSGNYHGQIVTLIRPKHSERGRLLVANRQLYFVPDENSSSGSDGSDASNSGVTDDSYNAKTPTIKVLQW